MDTTNKFIDMCIGLAEIEPDIWEPKYGDAFYDMIHKELYHIGTQPGLEFYSSTETQKKLQLIWIIRQDDIQERFDLSIPTLLTEFYQFAIGEARLTFSTFEQLWLAFYMLKKHNMVWTGENWIEVD